MAEYWNGIWSGSVWYIAGQVLGLMLAVYSAFLLFPKKRDTLILMKVSNDFLFMLQCFLVGAITGGLLEIISSVRGVIFSLREKRKWADSPFWPILFGVLTWVAPLVGILSGKESPLSFFAAVGSTIAVIAYYLINPRYIKIFGTLAYVFWLTYAVSAGNFGGMISNLIGLIAGIVAIIQNEIDLKKNKNQEQ